MLTRTTSAVLSRRTSSLTLRVRGRTTSLQPKLELVSLPPRLPCEILEAIIGSALAAHSCPEAGFFAIRAFTRSSKQLREIALRLYFRDIVIDSRALFIKVWDYLSSENEVFYGPNAFGWIRSLVGPSQMVGCALVKNIADFIHLQSLEICFANEGLRTQDSLMNNLLNSMTHSPARHTLQKLALTEIPCIDNNLLRALSTAFPQLATLELGSTKRIEADCCLSCLEDALTYTRHSPIPDYYPNAEKLAVDASFAQFLAAMTKLKDLYLGLYLSDAYILQEHIVHSDEALGGSGALASFSSCAECNRFREETQKRERLMSMELSKALPSLTTIRWDTLFNASEGRDSESVEFDEAGFYFPSEGGSTGRQALSSVKFVVHRHAGSGEVKTISRVHSWNHSDL